MAQIFQISDGTTTIDLLNPVGNYHLGKWETGINQWKSGGVYSSNPLVDLSVPISKSFDNFQEKITIHITGTDQNTVISNIRALLNLLENSILYFTENNEKPIYISVKSDTETNTRYAILLGYSIEKLPDQFTGPFLTGGKQSGLNYSNIYSEIDIVLNRSYWLGNIPGTSTALSGSNQYSYNSVSYGPGSSTASKYITSKRTESNITHIYRFDTSASSWSSNLFGSAMPYALLPSSTTAGDILYIGTDTTVANSGPFSNVIFNISTVASGITGTWEYRVGAIWGDVGGIDYTTSTPMATGSVSAFTKSGIGEIAFEVPDNWSTGNLLTIFGGSAPNVTGYWLRFRVTSVSSPTVPQNNTTQPYTAVKSYLDIDGSTINGDLEALSKVTIRGRILTKQIFGGSYYAAGSLFLGIRKYSRGSNFTAYLNCADEQNPTGITVSLGSSSFADDSMSPTGRRVTTTLVAGLDNPSAITFTLDNTIASHFFGKFRAFWRGGIVSGTSNQCYLKIRCSENDLYTSQYITIPEGGVGGKNIVDFGVIDIPNSDMILKSTVDTIESIDICIGLKNTNSASNTIWSYDIVLIPCDENIVEIRELLNDANGEGFYYNKNLEIDNLSYPFKTTRAITRNTSTNYINGIYRLINLEGIRLPTERFRIWMLYFDRYLPVDTSSNEYQYSNLGQLFTIKVEKNSIYLLPRGSS